MPEGGSQNEAPTDAMLMASIVARDEASLTALYDRYSPLVLSICLRILHDRAEAEDVMVDIFWEVWRRAARFDLQRGSALTYLTTLTRSRAIDRRRSLAARGGQRTTSLDSVFDPASSASNPALDIVDSENRRLIGEALASLDHSQRQAIECAYFDGMSHSEIAARLEKPLGTIKTYIRTGLLRLKSALLRKHVEGGNS